MITTKCIRIDGLPGTACKTCGQMIYSRKRGARWLYVPILTHVPPKDRT